MQKESMLLIEHGSHAKQKVKTGLESNGILAILCHKVDMGNIVFCSNTDTNCLKMIHVCLISARKPQEDEIGMLFAFNICIFDFFDKKDFMN